MSIPEDAFCANCAYSRPAGNRGTGCHGKPIASHLFLRCVLDVAAGREDDGVSGVTVDAQDACGEWEPCDAPADTPVADVVVKPTSQGFVATWKGDRRKPRPIGFGATWQAAVADLRSKGTVH